MEDPDITDNQKERIKQRISELKEAYEVKLEANSQIKEKLQSSVRKN